MKDNFLLKCKAVKFLKETPNDDELLKLYGYYKQSTIGDINIDKPYFYQIKELKKYGEWLQHQGMNKLDAQNNYINFADSLIIKYGIDTDT